MTDTSPLTAGRRGPAVRHWGAWVTGSGCAPAGSRRRRLGVRRRMPRARPRSFRRASPASGQWLGRAREDGPESVDDLGREASGLLAAAGGAYLGSWAGAVAAALAARTALVS